MLKQLTLLFIFLLILPSSCQEKESKINGISFVASKDSLSQKHISPLQQMNTNYLALMPFGFISKNYDTNIHYNAQRQWFGETEKGIKQYAQLLQEKGYQIMIKPQLWIGHGFFTGKLQMESESQWKEFEKNYTEFIMGFAQLAQDLQVEIFCIGTELETFIINRKGYWVSLIDKIKKVYKGKLTYAANWDEYKKIEFWNQLDYIGIDGYFSLSDAKTPTVDQAIAGWGKWTKILSEFSENYNRPILFTEIGYRSMHYSGKEPWNTDYKVTEPNLKAQSQLWEALFLSVWKEDWFAGGFVWKWFIDHENSGGPTSDRFSPQNKPAQEIISAYYEQFSTRNRKN